METEVKCPICKKVIGTLVLDAVMNVETLGKVPFVHAKLDYRKASHTCWNKEYHRGTLCRKCAKQMFPEGYVYYVVFIHHGNEDYAYGSEYGTTQFKHKAHAEEVARYWTAKNGSINRVKAIKI